MDAARYLAGGTLEEQTGFEVDEEIIETYRRLGAPEDYLEGMREEMRQKHQAERGEEFELFEDNLLSVKVFQAMDTQWDRAGMDGVRTGLKFNRVPIFFRMLAVPRADRVRVLSDLKVMERESITYWTEQLQKRAG